MTKNENLTKILRDDYNIKFEQIAVRTGASYYSVRNWYKEFTHPQKPYQEKLLRLLKRAENERQRKAGGE